MTEILTVAKSTLQFFISAGTTILRHIKTKKSKNSLTKIRVYIDCNKTNFYGNYKFSMKFVKRNEISGLLYLAEMIHSLTLIQLVRK